MLMSALRALINNSFQENFDIILMENEKKTVKILIFFSLKTFFK